MQTNYDQEVLLLIKKHTRTIVGRIATKEFRPKNFLNDLLRNFSVTKRSGEESSPTNIRMQLQKLLQDATSRYCGSNIYPELSATQFLLQLNETFALKPRTIGNKKSKMKTTILRTLTILLAIMTISCGPSRTEDESVHDNIVQLENEIMEEEEANRQRLESMPVMQETVDTLLGFLGKTQHLYTRNVLIRSIAELQGNIEGRKAGLSKSNFSIFKKQNAILLARGAPQQVFIGDTTDANNYVTLDGDTVWEKVNTGQAE